MSEEFIKHPSVDLIDSDKIIGIGLVHTADIEIIIKNLITFK
jgi:hypothetical protein